MPSIDHRQMSPWQVKINNTRPDPFGCHPFGCHPLSIPSFHRYPTLVLNVYGQDPDGVTTLDSLLKKRGQTYQMFYMPTFDRIKKDGLVYWKEKAKSYEAVVAFLREHL